MPTNFYYFIAEITLALFYFYFYSGHFWFCTVVLLSVVLMLVYDSSTTTPFESLAPAPECTQIQRFFSSHLYCNFCSATIRTLKLGDRVLLLSLIQAENVAINSNIVGSVLGNNRRNLGFIFVHSLLYYLLSLKFCNSMLLGVITS